MKAVENVKAGPPASPGRLRSFWVAFNKGLALLVSFWLLIEVFHVTFDILCRYLFNYPFPGTMTISIVMLMFLVYLGAAYCEMVGGHIRVDLLSEHFSKGWQRRLDLVWLIGGLSLLPLMAWSTYKMAMESYRVGEMAMDIALPMYPGKFVISIGLCLWTIQILIQFVDHLRGVEKPRKGGAK